MSSDGKSFFFRPTDAQSLALSVVAALLGAFTAYKTALTGETWNAVLWGVFVVLQVIASIPPFLNVLDKNNAEANVRDD
jgi:hypothetical protein